MKVQINWQKHIHQIPVKQHKNDIIWNSKPKLTVKAKREKRNNPVLIVNNHTLAIYSKQHNSKITYGVPSDIC